MSINVLDQHAEYGFNLSQIENRELRNFSSISAEAEERVYHFFTHARQTGYSVLSSDMYSMRYKLKDVLVFLNT